MRNKITREINGKLLDRGKKLSAYQEKALDDLFASKYQELDGAKINSNIEVTFNNDVNNKEIFTIELINSTGHTIYISITPTAVVARSPKQEFQVSYTFSNDEVVDKNEKYFYLSTLKLNLGDYKLNFEGSRCNNCYGKGNIKITKYGDTFVNNYFEIEEMRYQYESHMWVTFWDNSNKRHEFRITNPYWDRDNYVVLGKLYLYAFKDIINIQNQINEETRKKAVLERKFGSFAKVFDEISSLKDTDYYRRL